MSLTQNSHEQTAAAPQSNAPSVSDKPVVLALWASLKMAEELAEFCCSGYETIKRFEFEVFPAAEVGQLTGNGSDPASYTAILLAYAQDDEPVAGLEEYVREWARYKSESGEKPMIICREGLLPSGQLSKQGQFWNAFLDSLCEEFSADVIRDSRLLFSAMQSGKTEQFN